MRVDERSKVRTLEVFVLAGMSIGRMVAMHMKLLVQ